MPVRLRLSFKMGTSHVDRTSRHIASDLEDVVNLAKQAGPDFTSLQLSREELAAKLEKSERSFASKSTEGVDGTFLLALVDAQTGRIVGLSSIKSKVCVDEPFFNYKILRQT